MGDLYDVGFADGIAGSEPVVLNLDTEETALYMRGFENGRAVLNVLEPS